MLFMKNSVFMSISPYAPANKTSLHPRHRAICAGVSRISGGANRSVELGLFFASTIAFFFLLIHISGSTPGKLWGILSCRVFEYLLTSPPGKNLLLLLVY